MRALDAVNTPARTVDFPPCVICGESTWRTVHRGRVRDGVFGKWRDAEVCRCGSCGVDRLAESACLESESYRSEEYRQHIGQDHDPERHFATHDELARFTLEALWPVSLRGKVIADVGCGGGALLDHLRGVAGSALAIDPGTAWAPSLRARGYKWYASVRDCAHEHAAAVDVVLSTQVIEHVDDPRAFLADIGRLLKPDGIALVSTPNRRDVLMELLPDTFPSFFYRTQHRWAFDAASLSQCARRAGLEPVEVKHVHRYGISNTLYWLKEGKPRGRATMPPVDAMLDKAWQGWLEANARADNLYMVLRRQAGAAS
jgi:2-polyprenyl-3-methyl-5-hydroxy-6-metoxy-1,4-benzoquinol methylase